MKKEKPSGEKARRSIEEARNWIEEASRSLGSGARRAAFISIYLAYFHSARALLFNDGYREKSHFCIGVYLQKLVNDGKLNSKWPVIFHSIRNQRHTQQYSFQTERNEKEIKKMIEDAADFIEGMESYLDDEKLETIDIEK